MRSCVQEITSGTLTEYTKEESEQNFGSLKQRIFHVLKDGGCVEPISDETQTVFKNPEWPCLIFPKDYRKLKRDTLYDGTEADLDSLMEDYGERNDPTWYRDDITPFLDILAECGTKVIHRWSFMGSDHVVGVPVQPFTAQKGYYIENIEAQDTVPGEWLLHDDFCDWGICSHNEEFRLRMVSPE